MMTITSNSSVTALAIALQSVKYAADYARIRRQQDQEALEQAWQSLSPSEQNRITNLVNQNKQPSSKELLAELLAEAATFEQLTEMKTDFGHDA